MNRRDLLAGLGAAAAVAGIHLDPHMRRGPWVQEMLLYRGFAQRLLAREAHEFGLDAIGFNLLPVEPGGAQLVRRVIPFAGEDLARPTGPYLRRLVQLVDLCERLGLEVFTWGPSFPDIRRFHPTFSRLRFRGRLLSLPDWAAWSDPVHEAWSHHQRRVDHELGDAVTRIDGIEPYSWLLPPPPNHFTAMMAADFPGILACGRDHRGFNPVLGAALPAAQIVTSDGWGNSQHRWAWQPRFTGLSMTVRRRLASLPNATSKEGVAAYFVDAAGRVRQQGARVFLVLHTSGWHVVTYAEAQIEAKHPGTYRRPVAVTLRASPFRAIYRALAKAA